MKYLSLFSGIGGFEVGIENSKYGDELECIGYAEIDKYADQIYRTRFPEHKAYGDVTKLQTADLPDFDLLVAGFPCQSFSVAGKRRGFDDTRGTLFFEIARLCRDKRPRYLLLENVKGLLSHNKGQTFKRILEVLSDLGYDVSWEVLNSKNFGVPQNRERIFIKGYLREKCGAEVLHIRGAQEELVGEQINKVGNFSHTNHHGGNVYDSEGLSPTLLRDSVVKNGLHILEREPSERKLIKMNNRAQAQTIYSTDGIGCTLSACGGGDGGKTGLYAIPDDFTQIDNNRYITTTQKGDTFAVTTRHRSRPLKKKQDNYVGEIEKGNFQVRRLIPLECERLQGFPMINLEVDIWLSDQARKNVQYVVEKCLREQKPVGNVEKDKLQKNVLSVEKNSQVKNQKTNKLAPKSVHIHYEGKKIQLHNLEKLKSDAKIVEEKNGYLLHIEQENFARLIVGMNTIVEKIIQCGKEELVQNEQWQIHQENGKLVVKLSGNEMTPLVNFAEKDSVMINKLTKFITSDPSSMRTQDMMLTTLYYYVIGVIIGSIPAKINTDYLEKINLQISTGWTEVELDGKPISDTQRYKCCGNAVTTNVITHIFDNWDLKEEDDD